MRVHHICLTSTSDCAQHEPELLALLDSHPEFYYRIVGNSASAGIIDGEAGTRLALAAAHVVVVIADRAQDQSGRLAEQLRLAREGFSRRIPVLAVLVDEGAVPRTLGIAADRIVCWNAEALVDAIVECCNLAPVYRKRAARLPAERQLQPLPV